jgi:hypothetical protein
VREFEESNIDSRYSRKAFDIRHEPSAKIHIWGTYNDKVLYFNSVAMRCCSIEIGQQVNVYWDEENKLLCLKKVKKGHRKFGSSGRSGRRINIANIIKSLDIPLIKHAMPVDYDSEQGVIFVDFTGKKAERVYASRPVTPEEDLWAYGRGTKRVQTYVTFGNAFQDLIQTVADKEGIKVSRLMRRAVEFYIRQKYSVLYGQWVTHTKSRLVVREVVGSPKKGERGNGFVS